MLANKVQENQTTETDRDEDKSENIYINVIDKLTVNSKSKCATTVQSSEKAPHKQKPAGTDFNAFKQSDRETEK